MRKKPNAGTTRTTGKSSKASRRPSRGSRASSAGEPVGCGFGTGVSDQCKANAPQAEPSAGNVDGSAAGAPRSVDRRALRRILTWLLETTTEQQSLILSAMEIVSGPHQGSACPNERNLSPGALLRATLAERTTAVHHPPPADKTPKPATES